jgi:hypothetical protein
MSSLTLQHSGDMTRADKNLIDRKVTAAMPIWSCVLYQVPR